MGFNALIGRRLLQFVPIVVFATFVPGTAPNLVATIFVPLWLVSPAALISFIQRTATRSDEQPVSLLALDASRAPPAHVISA